MPHYTPTDPAGLVDLCARACLDLPGPLVVGVDGAVPAHPEQLASTIAEHMRARGRAAEVVAVTDYIRPASLRLEHGPRDAEGYRTDWFDYAALHREVIDSLRTHRRWLPRLWDERSDRSFRDSHRIAADDQVILVAGPMVLRDDLAVDLGIALRMSAATLRRELREPEWWTIEPLLAHQATAPAPDIEVRYDHPDRPAVAVS